METGTPSTFRAEPFQKLFDGDIAWLRPMDIAFGPLNRENPLGMLLQITRNLARPKRTGPDHGHIIGDQIFWLLAR